MANIGSVVIQFLAENKMGKTLSDVKKGLSGVDKESGKTDNTIGKLFKTAAIGIPIVGGIAAAAVGAASALIDMSKSALEDRQSSDRLAGVLKKIPGITDEMVTSNEDWISSMQLATQVSDTDLRAAVQKLALATGDLKKAQDLTTLAIDTASASGKSLSSVTDAMAKAASGNTSALKRMFPWLDKNKNGTVTYAEAVKGLTGKFAGAAKEAAKTSPWVTIGIIWDELKEAIGSGLLPVLDLLSGWFADKGTQNDITKFTDKVADLAHDLGVKLAEAIRKVIWWFKQPENKAKVQEWIEAFKSMGRTIAATVSAIKTLIGWMNRIPKPFWQKPGGQVPSVPSGATATTMTTRTAATATPPPAPVVMVTEEQIARAIQRILMRSDARNGRMTRIA